MSDQPKDPEVDYSQRIKELESELEEARRSEEVKSKQVRNLQASKDRANARLNQLLAERQVPASRAALNQQQQLQQQQQQTQEVPDLEDFRDEQALETFKLRTLMNAGLTEDDLDPDLEFSTPAELQAHIKIMQLEKKLAEQGRPVDSKVEDGPLPTRIDLGGPTSEVPVPPSSATRPGSEQAEALRQEARDLKERGDPESLKKARLLVLEAAHIDPASILGKGRGGKTP